MQYFSVAMRRVNGVNVNKPDEEVACGEVVYQCRLMDVILSVGISSQNLQRMAVASEQFGKE